MVVMGGSTTTIPDMLAFAAQVGCELRSSSLPHAVQRLWLRAQRVTLAEIRRRIEPVPPLVARPHGSGPAGHLVLQSTASCGHHCGHPRPREIP